MIVRMRPGGGAPEGLVVRASRPGEEELLGRSAWTAFRSGEPDGWVRYFVEHPHRAPEDTVVAEVDGALAGHATALRLAVRVAGADVPLRGVAAVAVLPAFRRRGVAGRLVGELLAGMHERHEPLAMLYPFATTFYRRLGFGTCEWIDVVRVAPRKLPASSLRRRVRPLDRARDVAAIRRLYDAARAGNGTGLLTRGDYWWTVRVLARTPEGVVYIDPRGRVAGYLLYDVPEAPPYPRQACLVRELVAADADAFRGLVGFLEALGEQIAVVELSLPRGEAAALLEELDMEERPYDSFTQLAGYVASGAMARIVHLPAAFAAHPGPTRHGVTGRIGLDVEDPVLPANARSFDVSFGARGVRVAEGTAATNRLTLTIDRLSQVWTGGARAAVLRAQGLIEGSPRAATLLDAAFAGPAPFLGRLNFF